MFNLIKYMMYREDLLKSLLNIKYIPKNECNPYIFKLKKLK